MVTLAVNYTAAGSEVSTMLINPLLCTLDWRKILRDQQNLWQRADPSPRELGTIRGHSKICSFTLKDINKVLTIALK